MRPEPLPSYLDQQVLVLLVPHTCPFPAVQQLLPQMLPYPCHVPAAVGSLDCRQAVELQDAVHSPAVDTLAVAVVHSPAVVAVGMLVAVLGDVVVYGQHPKAKSQVALSAVAAYPRDQQTARNRLKSAQEL